MRKLHKLEDWNKDRDAGRRSIGEEMLEKSGIEYTSPSKGHYKITSKKCHNIMFYPKTGCLIWKEHKKDYQHRFTNEDEGKMIQKIKTLI